MAYTPREIKDRVAVGDDIFIVEDLGNDRIRLIPAPTHILEPGTPVNKALLQHMENHLVPPGVIVMWSGAINDIPVGWALCDGRNGTPDLRDRFIVGAGGSYNVGSTGGAAQVTLTVNQLPSHSHQGTTSNAGAHTHTYYGRTDSMIAGMGGGRAIMHPPGTLETSSSGVHSHTFTTQATGGGQPHENRPPYYALAYIMKL